MRIYGKATFVFWFFAILLMGVFKTSASDVIIVPAATAHIAPGQNIQSVVDSNPEGTTFIIDAGVHRMQSIRPRTGDIFTGQDGAILNGSKVLDGFVQEGSYWVISGQTQEGEYRIADWQMCDDTHPRCYRPEDLFVNNVPLHHVDSLALVATGKWFFDYDNDRIYMGDNPAGKLVETSVSPHAFRNSSASNVTISNLTIEKYATGPSIGAIHAVDTSGWVVDNVVAQFNHASGIGIGSDMTVKNSRVFNNGQVGIHGSKAVNTTIEDNEVAYNNFAGFYLHWAVGGMKFTTSDYLLISNNHVYSNYGPGVWLDIDSRWVTVEGNLITDNYRAGVFNEINFGGIIRNNIVKFNNEYGYGGQIFVSNSSDVEVYDNEVVVGALFETDGIRVFHTDRGSGPYGLRTTKNNWVHNNTIVYQGGKGRSGVSVQDSMNNATFWNTYNNRFDYNTYFSTNTGYDHFTWNNNYKNWTEFRGLGQEANGTFTNLVADTIDSGSLTSGGVVTDVTQPIPLSWTRTSTGIETFHIVIRSGSTIIFDGTFISTQICTGNACTVSLPLDFYTEGNYLWSVQSMTVIGSSSISTGTFTVDVAPPTSGSGKEVHINQGRPSVSWQAGAGATWFRVYIQDAQGAPVHDQWYKNTPDVCPSSSCELITNAHLPNGQYYLYMMFWNPGGLASQVNNGWGETLSFQLNLDKPGETHSMTTTNQNSGRPTFMWAGAPGATWYEVWVGTPSPEYGTQQHMWYSALDMGCHKLGNCTLTPDMNLQEGSYTWYIRSWGPGGMSSGGVGGGWVEQPSLTVNASVAVAPDLITPQGNIGGTTIPDFTWKSVNDASWYHVEISASNQSALVYDMWHPAEQVQCNGTSCTLESSSIFLATGSYNWRVTAYTPKGVGPSSQNHAFTISN